MFDSKILITLIGLVVAVAAIGNISNDKKTKEHFAMLPSFQTKVDVLKSNNMAAAKKGDFYSVQGTYQAMLSPRFSNLNYGAQIKYKFPSTENLAVPCTPLTFGKMASKEGFAPRGQDIRENYSGGCGGGSSVAGCGKGGVPESFKGSPPMMQAGYANGNYTQVSNQAYSNSGVPAVTGTLPVQDMTSMGSDLVSGDTQAVVYDRFMFANRNSRLRRSGDKIRGDLAIAPCNTGWFQVSVQPNIDLEQGAMNVLGGTTNSQGSNLANLIYSTSGNTQTPISGVNMNNAQLSLARNVANGLDMTSQFAGATTAGQHDIVTMAYP